LSQSLVTPFSQEIFATDMFEQGDMMPSKPASGFRFFVLTCRDPKSDFRLPLVEALRRHSETYYIWLRRRPMMSGPGADAEAKEISLPDLLRFFRRFRRDDSINVYFNSTNTYFPGLSLILRLIAVPGIWCFDMHDDLRYHNTGLKRWREGLIVSALCRISHVVMHAAPTLQELFPRSRHLGNASHILPAAPNPVPNDHVLVMASFDERFDFDFLSEVAALCPWVQFHLHGWTRPHDAVTAERIKTIASKNDNVIYHGGYTTAELPGILASYRVTVAPYRVNTPITRYIDPLRYYHCLNAGLEVISTDIPQARFMERSVHVVPDAATCVRVLEDVRSGRLVKQPSYTPITWEKRAERLVEIVLESTRAVALQKGQPVTQS
jgi:hypothetical protein